MSGFEDVRTAQRVGSAAEWIQVDPILANGEHGVEEDTGKFKIGNGVYPWHLLAYYVDENNVAMMIEDYVLSVGGGTVDIRVGNLNDLTTLDKDNVVDALNEVNTPPIDFLLLYNNAKAG